MATFPGEPRVRPAPSESRRTTFSQITIGYFCSTTSVDSTYSRPAPAVLVNTIQPSLWAVAGPPEVPLNSCTTYGPPSRRASRPEITPVYGGWPKHGIAAPMPSPRLAIAEKIIPATRSETVFVATEAEAG